MSKNYLAMTLLWLALLSLSLATNTALQTDPPTGKTKDNLQQTGKASQPDDKKTYGQQLLETFGVAKLETLKKFKTGSAWGKSNGVKLEVQAKAVPNNAVTVAALTE